EGVKFVSSTDPGGPSAAEAMSAELGRMLQESNFASIDDANAFLRSLVESGGARIGPGVARTPLEEAQDVMYEAWESPKGRAIQLARKALSISPDCADAYVVLAQTLAKTTPRELELYELGVKAGERALGKEAFVEDADHFWGLVETRPYMRARAGVARCLFALGRV